MKVFKRFAAIALAIVMLFGTAVAKTAEDKKKPLAIEALLAEQTKDHIAKYYKFDITEEELYKRALQAVINENPELIEVAMRAMLDNLDTYSGYLTEEELLAYAGDLSSTFVGIGVTIEELDGYIKVIAPIKNSPAENAGIMPGDRIISVNGENIVGKGIEYTQSIILGEEGTSVDVGVLHENGTESVYKITRARVKQATVYPALLEDNIGYMQVTQFAAPTPGETKEALKFFEATGVKKLIIDVRNNPGGDKDALVEILKIFMPKGAVFHVNYKDEKLNETYYSTNRKVPAFDIAILINENSASAAEAFAGSMQDVGHTIVGMTSYGKGTVQMITPTIIGSAVKLTIATYSTAKKREINKVGVVPDAMIKNKEARLDENPEVEKMQYCMEINADSGKSAIKAVQQRLYALKYYRGETDGIFTEELTKAVSQFQTASGINATGELDIMTQVEIANRSANLETLVDLQLNAAIDILKTGKIPADLKTK